MQCFLLWELVQTRNMCAFELFKVIVALIFDGPPEIKKKY